MTCQCCKAPTADREPMRWRGTQRHVCNDCFGFITRWLAEISEAQRPQERIELPEPPTP